MVYGLFDVRDGICGGDGIWTETGLICRNVCCFKISNRSSKLSFVKNVIDSYMNNEVENAANIFLQEHGYHDSG